MKVLFISDVYSVGGAAKALGELALELKKAGIEPIVCQSRRDDFSVLLDQLGIDNFIDGHLGAMDVARISSDKNELQSIYKEEQKKYLLARKEALTNIEKHVDLATIDLIHTNSARNDIGCLLHEKFHIPHVMHLREFGQEDFNCWVYKRNYYNYLNRKCNRILAVSDAVRLSWIKKGIKESKVQTLYDGVDFSDFLVKNPRDLNSESLKIVMTGGVCETKGQHVAIEALHLLPNEIKEKVELSIVGWFDYEYLKYLEDLLLQYDLKNQVTFLGKRDNVGKLLHNYDLGLMCSKSEGFGRVTVEYMYAGLGVIASNSGACPELVKHNHTGMLFDREKPQELADGMVKFFHNREFLRKCAINAHEEAMTRFSAVKNAKEIMKVYNEVLLLKKKHVSLFSKSLKKVD